MSRRKRKAQRDNLSFYAMIVILIVVAYLASISFGGSTGDLPDYDDSDVVTTSTGLQFVDTIEGNGAEAVPGAMVSVHYTGWLESDGSKFDSSVDRGTPFEFLLGAGSVIRGWDEGVAGMKVGGTRILIIPADLGYGPSGTGSIPGGATLVFQVELLDVLQ